VASRGRRISPQALNKEHIISSHSFADLGISNSVVNALSQRGITEPFPVQRLVIQDVIDGRDVLVQSPTGSGKTLAFGTPIIDSLEPGGKRPMALVLAPTRELASQIVDELDSIAKVRGLKIAAVYGGVGFGPQIAAARKAHMIVATPGRLEDLLERGSISLKHIQTLVLDEADRMLDMGFKPPVDRIVAQTPAQRQTLFFSATLEGAIGKVASEYTRDPRRHTHAPPQERRAKVEHRFLHVDSQSAKLGHLVGELKRADRGRTLVFVRTKRGADRLVKRLRAKDVDAVAMHGDKSQSQRERALARFERGDVDTLIATDVAARGIDVADITHVINFDAPGDRDAYVHRVGRTGRAGRPGAGVSFVLGDQVPEMHRIARELDLSHEFDRERNGAQQSPTGPPKKTRNRNRNRNRGRGPRKVAA
jgi:superfamily II DNA/RNA helicase